MTRLLCTRKAYCVLCRKDCNLLTMRIGALRSHATSAKHKTSLIAHGKQTQNQLNVTDMIESLSQPDFFIFHNTENRRRFIIYPDNMTSAPLAEVALFGQCAGSSSWQAGSAQVLASIYGPSSVRLHREMPERATLSVEVRPAVGPSTLKEVAVNKILSSILETVVRVEDHPRTQILVQIQLVSRGDPTREADTLCATINAMSLALLDAQIPLHCTPVALVSSAEPKESQSEENTQKLVIVRNGNDRSILAVHHSAQSGKSLMSVDQLEMVLQSECPTEEFNMILDVFKRTLIDKFLMTV